MHPTPRYATQSVPDFHRLMKEVLTLMKIKTVSNTEPEVYSFKFNKKTAVYVLNPRPDSLDVLVNLGVLHNRKAHTTLLELLAMNRYHRDQVPLNIGMDPVTGVTSLWTRESLRHLDSSKLISLLRTMLDASVAAQRHLSGMTRDTEVPQHSDQRRPTSKTSNHRFDHLLSLGKSPSTK